MRLRLLVENCNFTGNWDREPTLVIDGTFGSSLRSEL